MKEVLKRSFNPNTSIGFSSYFD